MTIRISRATMLGAMTACVLTLTLTACSGDQEPPESSTGTPEPTLSPAEPRVTTADAVEVEPIWTAGEYLIEVGVYGDVAVVVAGGEPDMLTGVDVSSGEVLWETETNRGAIEATDAQYAFPVETGDGQPLLFNLTAPELDETVYHYYHGVELLDPSTGEQVKDMGRHWVGARWACELDLVLCAWVAPFHSDGQAVQMRLNPETLEFEPLDEAAPGAYARVRAYAGELFGVQTFDGDELLVRYVGGEELWSIPAADALGEGAAASGEAFAGSNLFDEEEVLVIYGEFNDEAGESGTVKAGDHAVAALDLVTGEILWTDSGFIGCAPRVFCSGDLTFEQEGDTRSYPLTTGEVRLTGLEARTGEEKWAIGPVSVDGLVNTLGQSGYMYTEYAMYLDLDGVTQVIDIETGEMTPLGSGFAACWEPAQEPRSEWSNPELEAVPTTVGGQYASCNDADGVSTEARFTDQQVEMIEMGVWQPAAERGEDLPSPRVHVVNTVGGLLAFEF